jgi:hypothetical protein
MLRSPSARFGVLIAALAVALITTAEARTFKASAVNAAATISNGLAQVEFKIEVTNDELSAMTNVFVVFEDGTEVSLGDVDVSATVRSESQSRTIDIGDSGSRTVAMKVTLKYSLDGDTQEVPWILSVTAAE